MRRKMFVELRTGQTRGSVLDPRREAVIGRLHAVTEELLENRSISTISLGTILGEAGVARATFYKLFNDLMHLYQFISEGLSDHLRQRQLAGLDEIDPEDWIAILAHLGDAAMGFYQEHPAAVRLWFAIDSPLVLRAQDQENDARFLVEFHRRFRDTSWHRRLPDPTSGMDVFLAIFRIHDALISLAFQSKGPRVPDLYFEDAKRTTRDYLARHLERAGKR